MLVRTLAPLCFFVLGRDGVVSGREGKKHEIKLLVPSDELVDEVEELVLDAGVPARVLLKSASEFEPSIEVEPPVSMGVDQDIFQVGHDHLICRFWNSIHFSCLIDTSSSSSGTLNCLMHLLLRPLLSLDRYPRFLRMGGAHFFLR